MSATGRCDECCEWGTLWRAGGIPRRERQLDLCLTCSTLHNIARGLDGRDEPPVNLQRTDLFPR